MVFLSGNAPESYANLAIKCFIRAPAVFQLQEDDIKQWIAFTLKIGIIHVTPAASYSVVFRLCAALDTFPSA